MNLWGNIFVKNKYRHISSYLNSNKKNTQKIVLVINICQFIQV